MTSLALVKDNSKVEFGIIEQVVIQGDLAKLSSEQRVTYYNKVCETIGLNPYTRPFDYIAWNGKLTLYATKNCTEQLRQINGVSIEKLESNLIDDIYIVKATAKDKHGRLDESTGAVVIGHLKGEAKANAIMKAETKAKRRVTLSISGLGWTDESETDSIPGAKKVDVDMKTGELLTDSPKKQITVETIEISPFISSDQVKELSLLISKCNESFQETIWERLEPLGIKDYSEMDKETYNKIKKVCNIHLEKNKAKYANN